MYQIARGLGFKLDLNDNWAKSVGERIHIIRCTDLETQDHVIRYQLPVLLSRISVGLIVIDSVTANYRSDYDISSLHPSQQPGVALRRQPDLIDRSIQLQGLVLQLRTLARQYNVAVVLTNQVTDVITDSYVGGMNVMSAEYQARFTSGWDFRNVPASRVKQPALGHAWTSNIDTRIVLYRNSAEKTDREIGIVFCPFLENRLIKAQLTENGFELNN